MRTPPPIHLGLRENLAQFLFLALANCFVGGVVGAQRSILPLAGADYFGLESATALTTFVVSFGIAKACTNLMAGRLAGRMGRRNVLLLGWVAAIPIPFLLAIAADQRAWWIIVAANILLGLNQGFCWTMTVVMKIDLVGPRRRGFALGVNESAGYTFVALSALIVAMMATSPMPLRGVIALTGAFAAAGFLLTLILIRDTTAHLKLESGDPKVASAAVPGATGGSSTSATLSTPSTLLTSYSSSSSRPRLAASQAGLVCNMNDAVIWTTLPPFLAAQQLDTKLIGLFAALYPAVWGLSQLATGALSDRLGRTRLIVIGMLTQGAGHFVLAFNTTAPVVTAAAGCTLLGLGTALAYPSLLAFVADNSPPDLRSKSLGSYRFFRDMGYAVGALAAGLIADASGFSAAIHVSGIVTVISGIAFFALARPRPTVPTPMPVQ